MAEGSKIAWTDHTFNPWIGCLKVSAGCRSCYAERLVTGRMGRAGCWGPASKRPRTSEANWRKVRSWNRAAEKAGRPARVFCGSLMDWAEDHPDLPPIRHDLWDVIRHTPWLHWQLLTKRAGRISGLLPTDWENGYPNVWLGVSVEDMENVDRVAALRAVPAVVRFISYEPALGPLAGINLSGIDWVIQGGESGPGHREMPHEWARDMRDACEQAGVAFFFKQSSAYRPGQGEELDGVFHRNYPMMEEAE